MQKDYKIDRTFINSKYKNYEVIVDTNVMRKIPLYMANFKPLCSAKKAVIICDSNVFEIYSDTLKKSLNECGFKVFIFSFPSGEKSKNLYTVEQIYNFFESNEVCRSDVVFAFGGGVTGDIAGFAAATYLRGISYIYIPTSLLSQVDSSVGGKTGVNLKQGKNLVGAFYPPDLVLSDPSFLKTLPQSEFYSAFSEIIKCSLIKNKILFDKLCKCKTELESLYSIDFLKDIIYKCINIKKQLVQADEFDNGERKLLNFGHTVGHAIEKISGYQCPHAVAVGMGMEIITKISENLGLTEKGTHRKIKVLLGRFCVYNKIDINVMDICDNLKNDKKVNGEYIDLILLKRIGDAYVYSLHKDKLKDFFGAYYG